MSNYLNASELADLIGCRPNQRSIMTEWLLKNGWPHVIDRNGRPKVSRAYHDARMCGGPVKVTYEDEPNRDAFATPTPKQLAAISRKAANKNR